MKWLVLVHVMSAIIGVGPVFFIHVLLRKGQTFGQLKQSLQTAKLMELFPKIGGSLAVLTGLWLVAISDYAFRDFWIWISIVLYVCIQVTVIGIATPVTKKLNALLAQSEQLENESLSGEQSALLARADSIMFAASAMGTLLFIMMIMKPLIE